MLYSTEELDRLLTTCLTETSESVTVTNDAVLKETVIDFLHGAALFSKEDALKERARTLIQRIADSLQQFYGQSFHR
jgi:hypothetical protein